MPTSGLVLDGTPLYHMTRNAFAPSIQATGLQDRGTGLWGADSPAHAVAGQRPGEASVVFTWNHNTATQGAAHYQANGSIRYAAGGRIPAGDLSVHATIAAPPAVLPTGNMVRARQMREAAAAEQARRLAPPRRAASRARPGPSSDE
jgi:hypothetical protein